MSETEQKVRYGIGSAAAAAAIFAPLNYGWKGVLTGVAAVSLLSGIYGFPSLPFTGAHRRKHVIPKVGTLRRKA